MLGQESNRLILVQTINLCQLHKHLIVAREEHAFLVEKNTIYLPKNTTMTLLSCDCSW